MGLSVPAWGYIHVEKHEKKKKKRVEIVLKHATNGQSDKGFLLISTFVPKGLSAPALGLYTCIKVLRYMPGPGTGPLVSVLQLQFSPLLPLFPSFVFDYFKTDPSLLHFRAKVVILGVFCSIKPRAV